MIYEKQIRKETVLLVAKRMAVAARTAPKGRGIDNLEIAIISEQKKLEELAAEMNTIAETTSQQFFARDAKNILNSEAVLLLGTKISPMGLENCGYCGMKNCASKKQNPDIPCVFNTNDLGIAIGSAVSIAANNRIDNRVMFSVGATARKLKYFDEQIKIILAIALNVSSKNIFFDRTN